MLNQISWTDYLSSIIAISLLYYVIAGLHFYRYEIAYYFSSKDKGQSYSFQATDDRDTSVPGEDEI